MRICVIPARGGSKRIPRKNIRDFLGKPMLAWSIEAALKSECFEQIIVSTDDCEIAKRAKEFGAETPFLRPSELADDYSSTSEVVCHAIKWYQERGKDLDAVCCLYATAPMIDVADLRKGLAMLERGVSDQFIFTATTYASPIQRALRIDQQSGLTHMWQPENFCKRSQDLENAYHDAGQFYWGRPEIWLSKTNLFQGSAPLILPRWRVQDIDNEEDWTMAESICTLMKQRNSND